MSLSFKQLALNLSKFLKKPRDPNSIKLDTSLPSSSYLPTADYPIPSIGLHLLEKLNQSVEPIGSGSFKSVFQVEIDGSKFAFVTSSSRQDLLCSEVRPSLLVCLPLLFSDLFLLL
jgi:hypothetical protein